MYHCFGMVLGTLLCATSGATIVFPAEAFEPEVTLKAIQDEACTALHGVPTMFIAELKERGTWVDPTIMIFEGFFLNDEPKLPPAIVPYEGTLPAMVERGVKIGLGTDGTASNNTLDLLRDAGVDMERPEPVDTALYYFGQLVDELDRLI